MLDDLITIRRELHAHPELGFDEQWTSAYLVQKLQKIGLEVHKNIAKTGIVAVLKGSDPTLPAIAYRADMDALPVTENTGLPFASTNGCMHACGHDFHMTIALGVADVLSQCPPSHNVVFVFQPNEEGAPGELPSGAEAMCDAGIIEQFNIKNMFTLHVDPTLETGVLGVCEGALWAASGRFAVNIQGLAGHAAYPDRSHDALLAASQMINNIYLCKARQRPQSNEVISICKFNSGTAFNVIAETASFEGIVRAPSRTHLDAMFNILKRCASAIDTEFLTKTSVDTFYGALPVVNDAKLAQIARNVWASQAVEVNMTMASEDFSHFSQKVPSFFAMLGVKPHNQSLPPLHASNLSPDESAIRLGVDAMSKLIYSI